MYAIKGFYKDGVITLKEKPVFSESVEVLVIFPDRAKKLKKFSDSKYAKIDYEGMEKDLQELNQLSVTHLLNESNM